MALNLEDRYSLLQRAIKSESGQLGDQAKRMAAFNPASGARTVYGATLTGRPMGTAAYRYYDQMRQEAITNPGLRANMKIPTSALTDTDTFMNWGLNGNLGGGPQGAPKGGGGLTTGAGQPKENIPGPNEPGAGEGGTYTPPGEMPPPDFSTSYYAQTAQDYGYYMELLTGVKGLWNSIRNYYNLQWISQGQVRTGNVPANKIDEVVANNEKYENLVSQLESSLGKYGFEVYPYFYVDQGQHKAEFYVRLPGPDGKLKNFSIDEALMWLGQEKQRLEEEDLRGQEMDQTFEDLYDLWDKWQGQNPGVDPFADPNKWTENIQDILGDLGAMPDTTTFFQTIFDLLPMSNYSEANMPNMDTPERFAKWLEDLKATGFEASMLEPGNDQEFRDWLYEQAQSLNPQTFFDFDRTIYDKMTTQEVSELMKMINYGENGVLSNSEMRRLVADKMKPIKQRAQKDLRLKLSRYAEAGRGYSGVINRTTQDMINDLNAEEMGTTADVLMQTLTLAEQGKAQAITELSKLTGAELDAALQIAGLKGKLAGDYFTFLAQIGNVSASEYATKTEAYMAMQELQLKADLGIAGLDLEQYKTETGLDVEKLRLYAENYWKQQGFNFEVKKQAFNDAINRYETAAEISTMLQAGQTDRLVQMASLALKGQQGDREAWQMYQKMRYENYGLERGMDIQQAGMIADLMYRKYELGETIDMDKWIERNRAWLQQELLAQNIKGQEDLAKLEHELNKPGFWQTFGQFVGGAGAIVTKIWGGGGGD